MHDLVIRNGNLADGLGGEVREGDLAIDAGRITAVDKGAGRGREEIDARGKLVTPGFVDIHTHYDGQATWDPLLTPTSWHGVTTAVMGNCGVGFAPVAPGQHEFLIGLMEGVEDIPGTALHEGIDWAWETFPEYLDALERMPRVLDLGTQVPHGAVRAYVMGERGAKNEPATPEDIERMGDIVEEAVAAGALGFSMSRTLVHRAVDGEVVPGTHADEDEIFGIARRLGQLGKGLVELAPAGVQGEDMSAPEREVDWMDRLSREIRRPVSFALIQHDIAPDHWRTLLDLCTRANAAGADLRPQVGSRPTTLLLGHSTFNPFSFRPSYGEVAALPLPERCERLRDPALRARLLAEKGDLGIPQLQVVLDMIDKGTDKIFRLGERPDYEPSPEMSLRATAAREGRDAYDLLYDWLLELDGRQLLMLTMLGYSDYNLEPQRAMLENPATAFGLGDGGAHVGAICDASMTTSLLDHWAKRRTRGPKLSVGRVVRKMTHDTAALYGLADRGVLAPGLKADVNIIDFDALDLALPELVADLPAGASRLVQRAKGYDATILSGEVTFREGEPTGARPGRVLRG